MYMYIGLHFAMYIYKSIKVDVDAIVKIYVCKLGLNSGFPESLLGAINQTSRAWVEEQDTSSNITYTIILARVWDFSLLHYLYSY